MPLADYTNQTMMAWLKDADTSLGIPLHPLGEVNALEFYINVYDNSNGLHRDFFGMKTQIIAGAFMLYLVMRNMIIAGGMIMKRPRILVSWCCFMSAAPSVIALTNFCNGLVLLQKTYLILYRQKWIIYVICPFIIFQIGYGFIVVFCGYVIIDEQIGCMSYYQSVVLWAWLSINMPPNVILSTTFCYTAFKQYRKYGSDAWRRLARKGTQSMCLAATSNILFGMLVVFQIGGHYADTFFAIDCVTVSTILIEHCREAQKVTRSYNTTKDTSGHDKEAGHGMASSMAWSAYRKAYKSLK
ncbi:hypothetical protein BDF22DRAFT_740767 [Syncephalis plumigaleata]|nr:hypothetical protein BDF22DRAFT_740767 [Syncephalis plumigaleata]